MRAWLYLFWQWLRRELAGRYRGSLLGLAWPLLQPLAQIAVFTLVFHGFMAVRWPGASQEGGALAYAVNVLAGLSVFNFFSEILSRAPAAVLAQPNLVTKVRFPLRLLPAVVVGAASVHLWVGGAVAWLAALWLYGASVSVLLLPLVLVPLALYGLGLAWGLAALGVYLRDIGQIMPALVSLLMFLTPIFYPAEAVPPALAPLVQGTPLAWAVEVFRQLVVQGTLPDPQRLALHTALSLGVAVAGAIVFRRLRPGFADVL